VIIYEKIKYTTPRREVMDESQEKQVKPFISTKEELLLAVSIAATIVVSQLADGIRQSIFESVKPTGSFTIILAWSFYTFILLMFISLIIILMLKFAGFKRE